MTTIIATTVVVSRPFLVFDPVVLVALCPTGLPVQCLDQSLALQVVKGVCLFGDHHVIEKDVF